MANYITGIRTADGDKNFPPYILAADGVKVFFGTEVSSMGGDTTAVEGAVTNDLYVNISNWTVLKLMSTGIWIGQATLAN